MEMGEYATDYPTLVYFLKSVDTEEMITRTTKGYDDVIKDGKFDLDFLFTPVVERKC